MMKHLAVFTDFYRDKKKEKTEVNIPETVEERLSLLYFRRYKRRVNS